MKPITIAVSASKGGTAKSTTAWALASILSRDSSVLIFDADPQGTITSAVAVDRKSEVSVANILLQKLAVEDVITSALPQYGERLKIVPSSPLLTGVEVGTAAFIDRQHLIADALANVFSFDFIIIDTPAGQSILTTGALVAADIVLSPVACQPTSFDALGDFESTIAAVRRRLNPNLRWYIAPTLLDQRQLLDHEVLSAIKGRYAQLILSHPIRRRVAIPEQMAACQPCTNPDYEILTQNLLEKIKHDKETIHP